MSDSYRQFLLELFGFFGMRRHAPAICDDVEGGRNPSWEACLLLKDGEAGNAITGGRRRFIKDAFLRADAGVEMAEEEQQSVRAALEIEMQMWPATIRWAPISDGRAHSGADGCVTCRA